MSFSERDLLLLTIVLPIVITFLISRYVRRRRAVAHKLGDARLVARLGGADLMRFPFERLALLAAAAALLGIAAAGPHWGIKAVEGESRSLNVVLAIDISKSMLARDLSPNRLERERLLVRRLLRDLAQERVGMVVFAGRAYILAPLTSDQGALQLFVDALDPDIVSQGGSALSNAISLSSDLARGPQGAGGERAVVLITDGEAHESEQDILEAAERAGRSRVKIFTVAVGTARGAPIPEVDPESRRVVGYKRDPFGTTVISRTNPELLSRIAEASGGKSYDLAAGNSTVDLVRQLRKLQRTPGSTEAGVEPRDQTVWFVALALLLLAADFLVAKRRRAQVTQDGRVLQTAALVLLVAFNTAFALGELERGNRLYRAGKYAEAVREYEKAVANGNDSPELLYNLGTALLRVGRYEDAEKQLRLALRELRAAVRQRAYYNLGNRYLEHARKGGDPQAATQLLDAAVETYKQALRLEPGDMDAKWNLELALREREKQSKSPSGGGETDRQPRQQDEQQSQSPSAGGGAGSASQSQSSAGQGRQPGQTYEQRPMSQEQADRILSAVEQDERQLTREKLRKGERRTPVARDW
ncbi:MAG: VWA domain-containing protein [Gemmatimonadota bacterium]